MSIYDFLIYLIIPCAAVALFSAACALNAMHYTHTRPSIQIAFLAISIGWACVLFAAVDYEIHNTHPHSDLWPILSVFGAFFVSSGNALLYIVSKRGCACFGCPGRADGRSRIDWWRVVP